MFRYVAPRRDDGSLRQELRSEAEELVLVPAGPVKDEKDRSAGMPGFNLCT